MGWKGDKTQYTYFDYDVDHHVTAGGKASYREINEWIQEQYGFKVSSLYIAQVKDKCGLEKRENYNHAKSEGGKVPKCPPEKEEAIMAAFKYFGLL